MDKTEWPTPARLEVLRGKGAIAMSPVAVRAAIALAVIATLLIQRSEIMRICRDALALLRGVERNPLFFSEIAKIFEKVSVQIAVVALVGSLAGLICVLAQSRMLLRFEALSFQLHRLNPFKFPNLAHMFGRVFLASCLLLLLLGLGFLIFRFVTPWALAILNLPKSSLLDYFEKSLTSSAPLICAMLGGVLLASWLLARFWFLYSYRMSRKEVEMEHSEES